MDAFGLPKGTEEEKSARTKAIQDATVYAIEVPFKTIERSFDVFALCEAMAEHGNPNSVSDAGVGALCARAAVTGAYLNVKINAAGLTDKQYAAEITAKAHDYVQKANEIERALLAKVEEIIDKG